MHILIVDGNNTLYRMAAIYTEGRNRDGEPIGALYGLVRSMRKLLADNPHDAAVLVTDGGTPQFRLDLLPEYKSTRASKRNQNPKTEAIYAAYRSQIPLSPKILNPLGFTHAHAQGWEGDDVIGALTRVVFAEHTCTVVSSDKDFIQLANKTVFVYDPINDQFRQRDKFYIFKKVLIGDTSDAIPGVRGIGDSRADLIVEQIRPANFDEFITGCKILAKQENPAGKYSMKVLADEAIVRRNYELMNLKLKAKKVARLTQFTVGKPDEAAFAKVAKKLGITPLLQDLRPTFMPFADLAQPPLDGPWRGGKVAR